MPIAAGLVTPLDVSALSGSMGRGSALLGGSFVNVYGASCASC
jgi:hypothetical protein